jgi:ABC-type sugar transport system ATPase subunit
VASIQLENVTKLFQEGFSVGKLFGRRPRTQGSQTPGVRTQPDDTLTDDGDRAETQTGDVLALDALDLTVADGETMVIVGPSGCGKSTLLRVIAGLTDYEGRVLYDGRDVREIPVKERHIGMVFQSYALYPHFYGQGNLKFYFNVNKAPDEEAEERIRATSEMMGFGFRELLRRKPGTLSGGQQQRLAIARALVRQPELFLFDEPLSNLDAKLRSNTRVEIKRLLHRFRITAMYVTHDQVEAMALGDRIAVMRDGRIEQVGIFRDILIDPDNAFVAGFLGLPPMNLMNGVISDSQLNLGRTGRFPLPQTLAPHVKSDQKLIVGIRPEAARIWTGDGIPDGLLFRGTIDVVEPDFSRRRQTAYISTADFTCSVTAPLETQLVRGYQVEVHFPSAALYFFDGDTEGRIR